MFLSPELMEQVRSFAYSAVNTNTAARHNTTTGPITLPDNVRDDIWSGGGMSSLYGIVLHELIELGIGQKYNKLFGDLVSSTSSTIVGGGNTGNWVTADDELMVGVDLSRESLIRPVARQFDSGGTFSVLPDDQFVQRAEKQGFYGFLEEGRVCIDARALVGIVV